MKILGIIAEYNPFHNGHEYQIKKAKEMSGADYIIAIMSGNYVQRGAPAIFDKSIRTNMALNAGIDAVFEIPALFSGASANDFAGFGISLLKILGVDFISFGAENDNYKLLDTVAKVLTDKEQELAVKKHMAEGLNYAKARHNAIIEALKEREREDITEIENILSSPNNILAIEYLKSIRLTNADIHPVIISRSGSGYHEKEIEESKFSSATAIRKLVSESNPDIFMESIKSKPVLDDDFLFTVHRSILEKLGKGDDLSEYCDVSKELANTMEKNIFELENKNYSDFILKLKSKNFTYTRISRAIFHLLLNHKKKLLEEIKAEKNMAAYPMLLGFRKDAGDLLSELKKRSELPIISKVSNAGDILSPASLKIFENNIYADFLYNSIYFEKYGEKLCNPYRRNVVMV